MKFGKGQLDNTPTAQEVAAVLDAVSAWGLQHDAIQIDQVCMRQLKQRCRSAVHPADGAASFWKKCEDILITHSGSVRHLNRGTWWRTPCCQLRMRGGAAGKHTSSTYAAVLVCMNLISLHACAGMQRRWGKVHVGRQL